MLYKSPDQNSNIFIQTEPIYSFHKMKSIKVNFSSGTGYQCGFMTLLCFIGSGLQDSSYRFLVVSLLDREMKIKMAGRDRMGEILH